MHRYPYLVLIFLLSIVSSVASAEVATITYSSNNFSDWEIEVFTRNSSDGDSVNFMLDTTGGAISFDGLNASGPNTDLVDARSGFLAVSPHFTFDPVTQGTFLAARMTIEGDIWESGRGFFQFAEDSPIFVIEHGSTLYAYDEQGAINRVGNQFDFENDTFTHTTDVREFPFGLEVNEIDLIDDNLGTAFNVPISVFVGSAADSPTYDETMRFGLGYNLQGLLHGSITGYQIEIDYEPIPEPGTAGLLALSMAALLRRHR